MNLVCDDSKVFKIYLQTKSNSISMRTMNFTAEIPFSILAVGRRLYAVSAAFGILSCMGCASNGLKPIGIPMGFELPKELPQEDQERFEIKELKSSETASVVGSPAVEPSLAAHSEQKKNKKRSKSKKTASKETHPPGAAFVYPMRRPSQDPIWVGERLHYAISYFGVAAGEFTLEVLPYKQMGHRKVYHTRGTAVTSPIFGLFYRLNDQVESFIDYEGFFSHRFHVILDETQQVRNSLELNDSEKGQTYFWNRWNHKKNGYKETKEFAPIQPFSQDSLSALYYVRTRPLVIGSSFSFPVISEGKTVEAFCAVLRREKMRTPLGRIDTIVISPEMKSQGILKKNGDSFLWLSDDERRIPVRLEAKVRIGSVVASLKQIELGTPNKGNDSALESVPSSIPSQ